MAAKTGGFPLAVAGGRLLSSRPSETPLKQPVRLCTSLTGSVSSRRLTSQQNFLRLRRRADQQQSVRVHASSPAGSPENQDGSEKAGTDDGDSDLTMGLGDWREFRARLVKAGDVPLVTDTGTGNSTETGGADVREGLEGGASLVEADQKLDFGGSEKKRQRSSWAHAIARPEQGCLIVAHPLAFGISQQYFNQAVIFLFSHGPDGSAGVILNRPSQYTLGQVAGLDEFVPEFTAAPLYMGGDVGPTSLLCIHGVEDLKKTHGAQPVCPGIFLGGSQGAKEHIRAGKSKAMDYRWFARYSGWAPGQLEREVGAGVWFLAASSPNIVLKKCINLEKPLWREVMELMGGEYKNLAERTYGAR